MSYSQSQNYNCSIIANPNKTTDCTTIKADKGYKCCFYFQNYTADPVEGTCGAFKTVEINKKYYNNNTFAIWCPVLPLENSKAYDSTGEIQPFDSYYNFSMGCVNQIPRADIPYDCNSYQYKEPNKHWCCYAESLFNKETRYCSYYTERAVKSIISGINLNYKYICSASYLFYSIVGVIMYIILFF